MTKYITIEVLTAKNKNNDINKKRDRTWFNWFKPFQMPFQMAAEGTSDSIIDEAELKKLEEKEQRQCERRKNKLLKTSLVYMFLFFSFLWG